MDRRLHFNGIRNARDLGGISNAAGQRIRSGCLLRAAHLGMASCDDERLRALHLSRIIDLRTGVERMERPDYVPTGVEYLPLPVIDESEPGISHEKKTENASHIPILENLYSMILTVEDCRRNLGRAATVIMEHDFGQGCVLWHCTEGKDRCGLMTMTLLMALGVERKTITEDYLITNEVNAPRAEKEYEKALTAGRSERDAAALRDVLLAKERYINTAYAIIDRYGSDEAFLSECLYIPKSAILRFREAVLI